MHSSQKLNSRRSLASINTWMNKYNGASAYDGILLSFKRGWNRYTCSHLDDLENIVLSEINKPVTKVRLLHESTYTKALEQRQKAEWWLPAAWRVVQWIQFWSCHMEKVLWRNSGDGYTALSLRLIPLNCTIKNGKDWKSICILPQIWFLRIFYLILWLTDVFFTLSYSFHILKFWKIIILNFKNFYLALFLCQLFFFCDDSHTQSVIRC
jgi:hypothetical protein